MQSRSEQILDFTERAMRKGGPDAVSFRDIASAIGIKSASVHYHFPTKQDLTAAVTERYAARFLQALGNPSDPDERPLDRLSRLADAYALAYQRDMSTCLCAVLGSVSPALPDATQTVVAAFYDDLTAWTSKAMEGAAHPLSPELVVSLLQGAMVLTLATGKTKALDDARQLLTSNM